MNIVNNFKLNRKTLSSYYVAILIAFFVLQLIRDSFNGWTINAASYFSLWFKENWQTTGRLWVVFLIISILTVMLLRHFIVEPLGFLVDSEEGQGWEGTILLVLLLGMHIYLTNQIFNYSMPTEWMPVWLIRLLGGYRNTFVPGISAQNYVESWSWIAWLWLLGPLAFLFVRQKIVIKS